MRKKVTCEKSYDLKIQIKSAVFTHDSLQLNSKFISLLTENTFLQLTSKKGWISDKIFMLFSFVKGRYTLIKESYHDVDNPDHLRV